MRRQARAGRPHRRQRRQPRPQALPLAVGRRHRHPAGPPRPAAAGRGGVAQGPRRGRQLRLGLVQAAGQPGAARPHRAGGHRQQGPVRPRRCKRPSAGRAGLPVRGHHHGRRVHGRHPRRVGAGPGERHPGRAPGPVPRRAAAAPDRPLHLPRATSCSTRSWARAPPPWPPCAPAATTSATTPTTPTPRAARERVAAEVDRSLAAAPAARPDKAAAAAHDLLVARRVHRGRRQGHQAPPLRRRAPGRLRSPPTRTGSEWLVLVAGASTVAPQRPAPVRRPVPHPRRGQPCSPPPATGCSSSPPTCPPAARRRSRPLRAARGVALVDAVELARPAACPSAWPSTPPARSTGTGRRAAPGRL